jgi:hypothetical protein
MKSFFNRHRAAANAHGIPSVAPQEALQWLAEAADAAVVAAADELTPLVIERPLTFIALAVQLGLDIPSALNG